MPISQDEVIKLCGDFLRCVMHDKGTAAQQATFFLHPNPVIHVLHGTDLSLQKNYLIHQQLKDEEFKLNKNWLITPLHQCPDRVRAQGSIYWQARMIGSTTSNTLIKCFVGEDWIIQRTDNGELKIALYINSYHHFLPDSANLDLK